MKIINKCIKYHMRSKQEIADEDRKAIIEIVCVLLIICILIWTRTLKQYVVHPVVIYAIVDLLGSMQTSLQRHLCYAGLYTIGLIYPLVVAIPVCILKPVDWLNNGDWYNVWESESEKRRYFMLDYKGFRVTWSVTIPHDPPYTPMQWNAR